MKERIPRILVAGTHSGSGKTSVALALLSAFTKRSLKVQGFKVGPDYIDPGYHEAASGRPSSNLDTWMLGAEVVKGIFSQAARGADLSVIEGVMGLFDGVDTQSEAASTAEMAKLLKTPVLLVIDAQGMSRSSAAMVLGFKNFDPAIHVAGVILNRVSGPKHARLLEESIQAYTQVPVLGYLPGRKNLKIAERHLGLLTAGEHAGIQSFTEELAATAEQCFQLDKILALAREAEPLENVSLSIQGSSQAPAVRIGIARDAAFNFYYPDNLDLLRQYGAECVPFSPMNDDHLPDVSALYLGGGFPEVYPEDLAANIPMKRALKQAIENGCPTYAECGGLMLLAERLRDKQGKDHEMVGAIPGTIVMTERLQNFGYFEAVVQRPTVLAQAGESIRGHEFHYSRWDREPSEDHAPYLLRKPQLEQSRPEGFSSANLLASYLHLHFWARPAWAERFVAGARRFASAIAIGAALLGTGLPERVAWAQATLVSNGTRIGI